MNPDIQALLPYPFAQLRSLLSSAQPATDQPFLNLSIGEPKHQMPDFLEKTLVDSLAEFGRYPPTQGGDALREAIQLWLINRYGTSLSAIDPQQHIISANGTRESLFGIAQCVFDRTQAKSKPYIMMANPCYQIYEGAATMAGATPYYLPTTQASGYKPDYHDIPDQIWQQTQMVYYCSPGNPIGVFHDRAEIEWLLEKSSQYGFVIIADECYSEIYRDEANPPLGLLAVASDYGLKHFDRCISMNSLSKRSNLPGLRSGFIAGDASIIKAFAQLRSYMGNAMSLALQHVSASAWRDEAHVIENRKQYQSKLAISEQILDESIMPYLPEGGFFLWLPTPCDDATFAKCLYEQEAIQVLPGQYLGRACSGVQPATNPAANHIRVALVGNEKDTKTALLRIRKHYQDYHTQ